MRILVTNDDGINAKGLAVLASQARASGHEVVVAAPNEEKSGYGAALVCGENENGLVFDHADDFTRRTGIEAWAVDASPAMISYAAGAGLFGPRPDMIISGINRGANVGAAVVHSGTVGAAFSAAMQQIPAVAFSSASRSPEHWDTHEVIVDRALNWAASNLPTSRVLNVNVPDVSLQDLRGIRSGELSRISLDSLFGARSLHAPLFAALADLNLMTDPDSDAVLLSEGWATVSLLMAPSHDRSEANLDALIKQSVGSLSD